MLVQLAEHLDPARQDRRLPVALAARVERIAQRHLRALALLLVAVVEHRVLVAQVAEHLRHVHGAELLRDGERLGGAAEERGVARRRNTKAAW